MKTLVAFPALALAFVLQMAVVARIPLLAGHANLPMLVVAAWALQEQTPDSWLWAALAGLMGAFTSGLPFLTYPLMYLLLVLFARFLLGQVWQVPLLAVFVVTLAGTLLETVFSLLALQFFSGQSLSWGDALAVITLPQLFLNALLVFPVYSAMRDLAQALYPLEEFV